MTKTVRIIGNAPSALDGVSPDFDGVYLGVNTAPVAFASKNIACHACWVQDWRFFREKKALLTAKGVDLHSIEFFVADYINLDGAKLGRHHRVRSLGREGFSFDPSHGVFEGRSAAYGAIQLALRYAPERIELFGVDYSYTLGAPRFYQKKVGWDLDLHIHEQQIREMRYARTLIEAQLGVQVVFGTRSYVDICADAAADGPSRAPLRLTA